MRRVAPAFVLFFLSPFVAEFLLGDFTLTELFLLLVLAPMYGGACLVIREVTRRVGKGWPTMVVLGVAFGVLEEGLLTQSLFNPDYVGAHLLERGFVPALGIAIPWTIFVITIHTVWSISTPILIVEESTRARRDRPWLRVPGLVASIVLFLVGCAATFWFSYNDDQQIHFMAPTTKLVVIAVIVVALVALAFSLPRPRPAGAGRAPSPWWVFATVLVLASAFQLLDELPGWIPSVAGAVVLLALAVGLVGAWSRRAGWDRWHRFAVLSATTLTYAWHSFTATSINGSSTLTLLVSHVVFTVVAVLILAEVARRVRKPLPAAAPAPVA